ncbi:MAG TPA: hypothetical protein VFA41_01945 [Ktedonobacteraceae bacterium]|jgi:hypothetical protein|nr:hypothetical protein [Ktedonobacteraceae bacterium]
MIDCSQLQSILDEWQQERQALNAPETYCQDQCDPGDVECIKECLRSIPERRQAADQAIADTKNEMMLCGTWNLVVQGVVETNDHYEGSLILMGILGGTINLPDGLGNTPISGSYAPGQGTIQLLRPFSDGSGSVQNYQGSVNFSTSPASMQGQMRIDYGPGTVGIDPVYDWSAQKQS